MKESGPQPWFPNMKIEIFGRLTKGVADTLASDQPDFQVWVVSPEIVASGCVKEQSLLSVVVGAYGRANLKRCSMVRKVACAFPKSEMF